MTILQNTLSKTIEVKLTSPSLSSVPSEIFQESTHTADNMDRLYRVAARNLREYHGVPSMTPVKLTKTLALFKLCPRRLVVQGLAPMKLLTEKKAPPPEVAAGTASGRENENSEDTTETIVAEMQLMSVEGDKKESSDGGFEAVTNDEASMSDTSVEASNTPEKGDGAKNGNDAKKKNAIHAALLAADIQLKPRETRPLLVALGVNPRRLVRLGVVDGKIFSPMHGCRKGHCPRRGGPARDSGNCQRSLGNPRAVNSNACGPTRRHGACDGTHRHGAPRTGTMLHPPSPPAQVHAGPRCRCACGGPPVAHPHEYGSGWGEMTPMWMGRGMQQRGQARRGGGGGHGHQHFGFYMM